MIVTEWRFAPGAHTGWHVHAYDYVVVPLTTGSLVLDTPGGEARADLIAGQSYARDQKVWNMTSSTRTTQSSCSWRLN